MNKYTFYVESYHKDTSHLSNVEDLAYRRMLDYCYMRESTLPANLDIIAKRIRLNGQNDAIHAVLDEFFEMTIKGWKQKKVAAEIGKINQKSEKAKKSISHRWSKENKAKTKPCKDTNVLRTNNGRITNVLEEVTRYLDMANSMSKSVLRRFPSFDYKPRKWADDIRKLIEIDKRNEKEILAVWEYIDNHVGSGDFRWGNNIRTPAKLRLKKEGLSYYDRIIHEMNEGGQYERNTNLNSGHGNQDFTADPEFQRELRIAMQNAGHSNDNAS